MIDIKLIREQPDVVKAACRNKNASVSSQDVDRLIELDNERRELLARIEDMRRERNEVAASIKGGRPSDELVERGRQLKEELSGQEAALDEVSGEWLRILKKLPNIPAADVPVGKSEDENVVVKTVGVKPEFEFEPKNHWELAQQHDWIDKERAAKVAGSRFAYLKGDLVRLHFALIQFAMDVLMDEGVLKEIIEENDLKVSAKPFVPVLPPHIVRTEVYEATGRLSKEDTTYKLEGEDAWLEASAEHSLAPMYKDEILAETELPLRFAGYATSYRREAGTYGKDMEGIFRMHQFDKLELESFTTAEQSLDEHLFMIAVQEYLMQRLGLPYQVVMKCTADIGTPNARGVDIDVWLPGQNRYRETHTADLITDYQSRRLQTRVRRDSGEVELVHTNDATGFSQRPLIAIIENYQQADGGVRVPEVLRPYLGGRSILGN